ncbi:MAG: VOC family protein [Armatimonadetes bacterium]|nr:VOC family protein [Akkermansiaceae bacterium]
MIPEGYHSVTPSLTTRDSNSALEFYNKAFGATELFRLPGENGKVNHAEFQIGNSRMMISDEFPEWGSVAPEVGKGGSFMIYVEDCDGQYEQALAAGATSISPPADQFWGDRTAHVADPFGYRWGLAQHVRDVSPEELEKGAAEWGK